jgi:hypothetical protein
MKKQIVITAMLLMIVTLCYSQQQQQGQQIKQKVKDIFGFEGSTLSGQVIPKYKVKSEGSSLKMLETDDLSGCVIPKKISELMGGTTFKLYKFDKNMTASATSMGFTGTITGKQMLFVQDYVRWQNVTCNGVVKRVGIGLRCFIFVESFKGSLGGTLPSIAASVELGRAKAMYELTSLGFGIDGPTIADGLQPQGDYTVENFAKLAVGFSNTLKLLSNSSTMAIQPVILP